ncbi:hypothetical protein M406DRAFT_72186 [Cryphonectria parasitica EP155]|uniref:Uncharacterized protein n=1 Tax=Cryphonectria parasitica (strain ATCC 38755 / EP155) TaxID=660469 RepID=A0A9P4XWC2_CRYP1|nr:uncharacterized protein M406DRAFT_72186 [Cryphonectria parasitica EP155]KAF3762164.1 hypothetical protein M406DRAFT_72186 [Cryphonectria parasitica EP155]
MAAASPRYVDIDAGIMPDGSCPSIAPSTVSYSHSDHNSYSEGPHISSFGTSPVLDDHLLTPASSAASPQLQQRSCRQSPFEQQPIDPTPCSQQPTPPPHHNTTTATAMYAYPDYMNSVSHVTSSMSMPTTVAEQSQDLMGSYLHHSPGHEEPPPPPSTPYYGSYSVSVPPEPTDSPYYLQNAALDNNHMRMLQADVNGGGAYTPRRLAPPSHAPPPMSSTLLAASSHNPHAYQREFQISFPKLSPHGRHASLPIRRDPARKAKARRNKKGSLSPSAQKSIRVGSVGAPAAPDNTVAKENEVLEEEVTLDDNTPADLRRLWDIRKRWLGKKGNGMWEDIMVEYQGEENFSENKKTQIKAALQMKIHRMLLKHGKWPTRDEAALLRAYRRWEESRYSEILRLYEEEKELAGEKKAYEWKSQHIEAQLVKMGLEEPERDRDSKARKRKQAAARHHTRTGSAQHHVGGLLRHVPPPQHRLPGMFENPFGDPHYMAQQQGHYDLRAAYEADLAALGAQPPVLTEVQQDRLVNDILERNPFEASPETHHHHHHNHQQDDADVKMSDYAQPEGDVLHSRTRSRSSTTTPAATMTTTTATSTPATTTASMLSINGVLSLGAPPVQQLHHRPSQSPDINAQRCAAMARQLYVIETLMAFLGENILPTRKRQGREMAAVETLFMFALISFLLILACHLWIQPGLMFDNDEFVWLHALDEHKLSDKGEGQKERREGKTLAL